MAPSAAGLATLSLLVAGAVAFAASRPRAERPAAGRARSDVAILVLPYAAWTLFAQNVIEQPRHLLPLVTAALLGLGALVAELPRIPRRVVGGALVALLAAHGVPLALLHARTLPAAAQAVAYVERSHAPGAREVAVFGGRSIRFFQLLAPSRVAIARTWLSEVDVELERLDVLPRQVLVTSEVEADAARAARVIAGPVFCRDPRLDRAQPCLRLDDYRHPALRR